MVVDLFPPSPTVNVIHVNNAHDDQVEQSNGASSEITYTVESNNHEEPKGNREINHDKAR